MLLPVFLIVVVLSGCVGAGASSAAPASAAPTPCPGINLRTPQGSRIDLSGAWEGEGGLYHISQHGSCVWWVAEDGPHSLGADWLAAFHGQLAPDFTLRGEWAFAYIAHVVDRPTGEIVYQIDVAADGGTVTLRALSLTAPPHSPAANFPKIAQILHRAT
jgi:hypothetical protein